MYVPRVTVQDLSKIAMHLLMLHFLEIELDIDNWVLGTKLPPEARPRAMTKPVPSLRLIVVNFSVDKWPSVEDCVRTMSTWVILHFECQHVFI